MVNTNKQISPPSEELCNFIINKLGLSQSALELGLKRSYLENSPLPIVLWSYGLINLSELNIVFSWEKDH